MNRKERQALKARGRSWGAWEERSHLARHPAAPIGLVRCWQNDRYAVLLVARNGLEVLQVRRHTGGADFPWPDLQRIKNELVGPDREAVQVFPRADEVVDVANMAHLWLVPSGERLPYTFQRLEGLAAVVALVEKRESLGSVVGSKGGGGADVPAPAVPMEGEPGPVVQLGPARASIAQRGDGVAVDNPDEQINRLADYLYVTHAFDPDKPVVDTAMSIMESLVRSLLAKGRPSTWLPPNASDTHATAPSVVAVDPREVLVKEPGHIGQATMAGYPEPWEDE